MNLYAYVGIKIQYTILFVQNTVFKIYGFKSQHMHMHTFSYICNRYKIKITYKLIWFRTGHQSAFRESIWFSRAQII